jgi:hypothetical protein
MLNFFFFCLLAANGALFAFNQGYLETLIPSGREPARVANQFNASKIKLVNPAVANAGAASAPVAPDPALVAATVEKKQTAIACTEIGNFTAAEGKRFEAQLVALSLTDKSSRREIQEISSHMVFIPPQEGKDGADSKAAELRKLGITDFYVIPENSGQRWGISLGIFKTEEAARARLAALSQKGVRNARLIEYKIPLNRVAFQLRESDAGAKAGIEKIKAEFPRHEARNCG